MHAPIDLEVERYTKRFQAVWHRAVECIIEAGGVLVEAKAALGHGRFGQMLENCRSADALRRVARPLYGSGEGSAAPDGASIPAIDLFADALVGNAKASAYLLAAYAPWFSAGTAFLCVVDAGVGGARPAIILEADDRRYVGPGNGSSS
jgi:hypothetical protein